MLSNLIKISAVLLSVAASVQAAPPTYATRTASAALPEATIDPIKLLQDTVEGLGKDKDHPFIIPYCAGSPMNISTENFLFLEHKDSEGTVGFPEGVQLMMVNLTQPIDITPYDNPLAAMYLDVNYPVEHEDWVENTQISGVLFTSNSSASFDPTLLYSNDPSNRVLMQMGLTFTAAVNETSPAHIVIGSPFVRTPIPDDANNMHSLTSSNGGKFINEIAYFFNFDINVQVKKIVPSDIYLACLDAPTDEQLLAQGILYYKREREDGSYQLSDALKDASQN